MSDYVDPYRDLGRRAWEAHGRPAWIEAGRPTWIDGGSDAVDRALAELRGTSGFDRLKPGQKSDARMAVLDFASADGLTRPAAASGDGRAGQPPAPDAEQESERKNDPAALTVLERLAASCTFFTGDDGEAYVRAPRGPASEDASSQQDAPASDVTHGDVPNGTVTDGNLPNGGGGAETYPVASKLFSDWLRSRFYAEAKRKGYKRKAPTPDALQTALATLDARAKYDPGLSGPQHVFLRTAGQRDEDGRLTAIFVDLANEAGEVVRVSAGSWEITTELPPGVHLVRSAGHLPLARPERSGSLADVLRFVRAETLGEAAFVLAWLVFAFHPFGPYPVLTLHGAAGSGKSFATDLLVQLIDNRSARLRRPPKTAEDLAVYARSNHVLALNNLTSISQRTSDDLCSVATGTAFGGRTLYTNAGETAYHVCRPIVANGIPNFAVAGDLVSRLLKVNLRSIPPNERRTEDALRAEAQAAMPKIMGGIMNALAEALRHPDHKPERLPRMADFAAFIDAAQGGPKGTGPAGGLEHGSNAFPAHLPSLLEAMTELQGRLAAEHVEASGVATAFLAYAKKQGVGAHEGTMKGWLGSLGSYRDDGQEWPASTRALQEDLRRLDGVLREKGLTVEPAKRPDGSAKKDPVTRRALYVLRYDPPADPSRLPKESGNDPSDPSHPSDGPLNRPKGTVDFDFLPKGDPKGGQDSEESSFGHPSQHPGAAALAPSDTNDIRH